MRCTVCYRQTRYHTIATYRLMQDGKEINRARASRCALVQEWQSMLLSGSFQGHRMAIVRASDQCQCEHISHFTSLRAGHSYGCAVARVTLKTAYGKFKVCRACVRADHMQQVELHLIEADQAKGDRQNDS